MKWKDKEGQAELRRILIESKWLVAEEIAHGLGIDPYPGESTDTVLAAGKVYAGLPKGYSEEGYSKSTLCRLLVKVVTKRLCIGDLYSAVRELKALGKDNKACKKALAECESLLKSRTTVDVK